MSYNTNMEKGPSYDCQPNTTKLEPKASEDILNKLYAVIENLDENVNSIDRKLYLLLSYSEPSDSEKASMIELEPESFLDKLNACVKLLNSINYRLEGANRHMNKII